MPNTVNYARGPLSGITVLDLTQFLSGPFCTMIMADLGADILKIERPDRPRASGPYLHGERIYDLSVNRSKKSMTLNLKSDAGKDIFKKLLISSDVVIENFKPGTMERMGLGYEELKKIKPNLIYAAISGFGYTGPYKNRGALDMVIQGMSGLMSLTGEPNGRPTRCGTSASDIFSGIYMFGAVASALYEREKTGKGQFIDVAMLDSTFSCLENAVINTCIFNKNPERVGNSHPTSVPFQTFQTSDGEIIITCSRDSAFYSLCRAMRRPDMIQDERFAKAEARRLNKELLEDEITRFTSTRTLDECEETLNQFGVPNGRINTLTMICKDPQIAARDMIVKVEHPVAGTYQMAGSPLKFSSLTEAHYEPAPTLGQHTREILSERLNMTDTEIEALLKEQESMP
ncbi:CoA transferase [[Clostridium] symbiosum]|uniref:CaiB/BaiF CoA transferase family protein n=1 Tax=Clostridium symbiosum TaxID=1512 RepID=UPI001AA1C710|nr:CoA transferase [[Clostridium] symbiosum]MBO1695956.1 CoA transferase [[Clostridium] symbiosum]